MEQIQSWLWTNVVIPFLVLLGIVAVVYLLSLSKEEKEDDTFIRGRKLVSLEQARQAALKMQPKGGERLCWGGLDLPMSVATTHFAVAGCSGSGKTLTIQLLLNSVLPGIAPGSDRRALIYDPKRDAMGLLHGMGLQVPVRTLNPFDARGVAWDLAKDLTGPSTAFQMASLLIPADPHASQPFFTKAAQHLLYGVLLALMEQAGNAWTFADLVYAMQSQARIRELLALSPRTEELIDLYLGVPERAADILATVATKMAPYGFVAAAWSRAEEKVSLTDWLAGESVLVLGSDEANRQAMGAINQVIFKRVSELVLSQAETTERRTWIVLDEARQAGFLDGLDSLLVAGRSKGAAVVLGFQDISGMREVYGDKVANELVGQCGHVAVLRLASPATAQWAADLFGSYERYDEHASDTASEGDHGDTSSTTHSRHRAKREAVLGSEFLSLPPTSLPNGLGGFCLVPGVGAYRMALTGEWLKERLPTPDPDVPGFVPRPEAEQHLSAWSAEDRERLGLKGDAPQKEPARKGRTAARAGGLGDLKGVRQDG